MNNKQGFTLFALLIVILIVVAGGGAYYFVKQTKLVSVVENKKDKQIQESTTEAPQAQFSVPADWKTYRNEKYGFEFRYPTGLPESVVMRVTTTDGQVLIEDPPSCGRRCPILLDVYFEPNAQSYSKQLNSFHVEQEKLHTLTPPSFLGSFKGGYVTKKVSLYDYDAFQDLYFMSLNTDAQDSYYVFMGTSVQNFNSSQMALIQVKGARVFLPPDPPNLYAYELSIQQFEALASTTIQKINVMVSTFKFTK